MQYHTVQLIVDDINIVQLQSCIFYFSIFFFYFFNLAVYMNLYSSKKAGRNYTHRRTHTRDKHN